MKIKKKMGGWEGVGSGGGGGGQDGCEQRSEAFVKIQKKIFFGGRGGGGLGWGCRVDVSREVKFCENSIFFFFFFFFLGGGVR